MPEKLKHYQHKRPLRRYLIAVVLLVLAGVVWTIDVRQPVMLPIENVKLEGDLRHLSATELRETIADVMHGGYFTIDLNVVRDALLELPWVQDVSVRRQWPLGLYIKVKEKTAVARWGKQALISGQGMLFTPAERLEDSRLPMLAGPEGLHPKVIRFYNRLSPGLNEYGFNIQRLSLDQRRAWTMVLSGDVVVRLGRDDVDQRLARFMRVIAVHEVLALDRMQSIDMRYTNGFAMRPEKKEAGTGVLKIEV